MPRNTSAISFFMKGPVFCRGVGQVIPHGLLDEMDFGPVPLMPRMPTRTCSTNGEEEVTSSPFGVTNGSKLVGDLVEDGAKSSEGFSFSFSA